ncbi:MAG: hypothetical protein ACP59X_14920 [Solidesulfovibrio sp. DCME]|uniref:hypothetical protein n=1 Tax=Solidesulfovibrio sp. DCME TaxID=3447380 RepID=UPI003D14CF86
MQANLTSIRTVRNGHIELVQASDLRNRVKAAGHVLIDLGTGDASFPYREAKSKPDTLCIGVDPAAENMLKISSRIGRKPSRGGVDNLLLLVASVENLPPVLNGIATRVTILFPWSGLMRSLVAPDRTVLEAVRALLIPNGFIEALLNLQVFSDQEYRQRHDLPEFDPFHARNPLADEYAKARLRISDWEIVEPGQMTMRTTWGQHLTRGSGRLTLRVVAHNMPMPDEGLSRPGSAAGGDFPETACDSPA